MTAGEGPHSVGGHKDLEAWPGWTGGEVAPIPEGSTREGMQGVEPDAEPKTVLRNVRAHEEIAKAASLLAGRSVDLAPSKQSTEYDFPEVDLDQLDRLGLWN